MKRIKTLSLVILGVTLLTSCNKENPSPTGLMIVNETNSQVKVSVWNGDVVNRTRFLNFAGDKETFNTEASTSINVSCSKETDCKFVFNGWTFTKSRMFIKGEDY